MKLKKIDIFLILFLFIINFSCDQNKEIKQKHKLSQDSINTRLMNANKILTQSESEQIDDYIKRYQWDMLQSGSGLRYNIYKKTNGIKVNSGQKVTVAYKTSLLNGVILYSSAEYGNKKFEIGKAQVESGLEEGILLLKLGEKAKFIIPSHLAFGLQGDQNKIPRKATLVYDIELISVENVKQIK